MRRALRNLLFSLVLAAGVLGAAEAVLRVAGVPDPGLYAGDIGSVWTLRPGLADHEVPFRERGTTFRVRTSSVGYRGAEPARGAVVCLGDSTTFGWGVEEDEAWPARLGAALGEPTVNGGVPGHSTHQGLATLDTALDLAPSRVVLAWLVRDAELAAAPDRVRAAAPSRAPDLALVSLLRSLRPAPPPVAGTTPRVPAEDYLANLREVVSRVRAAGAEPRVLAFPMLDPPRAHLRALEVLATDVPVLTPSFPASAFFPEDPIHLTAEGNAALATLVADWLRSPGALRDPHAPHD